MSVKCWTCTYSPLYSVHDRFVFECNFSDAVTVAFVWVDDHEVCVHGAYTNDQHDRSSMDGSAAYPILITPSMNNKQMVLRVHFWTTTSGAGDDTNLPATVDILWQQQGPDRNSTFESLPLSALTPTLPRDELRRLALHKSLVAGWGAWHPRNYLSLVSLPDSSALGLMLCQLSTRECLTASVGPDDRSSTLRPGLHALDRSYGIMFVNAFSAPTGLNVSVRWGGGSEGRRVAVQPVQCITRESQSNCSDFVVSE